MKRPTTKSTYNKLIKLNKTTYDYVKTNILWVVLKSYYYKVLVETNPKFVKLCKKQG